MEYYFLRHHIHKKYIELYNKRSKEVKKNLENLVSVNNIEKLDNMSFKYLFMYFGL